LTHDLRNPPPGCAFHLRCPHARDICRAVRPQLKEYAPGQLAACHIHENPAEYEKSAPIVTVTAPPAALYAQDLLKDVDPHVDATPKSS
jgi:hypothetical protein